MSKAMLISVGGSISPIICSLNKHKPKFIIFFTSKESEYQVSEITKKISFSYQATEKIVTPSAEIMEESYYVLWQRLPSILERWKIRPSQIIVDYTGGTKSMSVAVVLATLDFCKKYSYIGGKERTKEGLGVVVDGKEKMLYVKNPWDKYAVSVRKKISLFFNECHYDSALREIEILKEKVSRQEEPFYSMWYDLIKGYALWDKFRHTEAKRELYKGFRKLQIYAYNNRRYKKLLNCIDKNLKFLERIVDEKESEMLIRDLIANAKRRAEVEKKFDDAVARLYRALEKIAENELFKIGINHSNVKDNQIPQNIRDKFISKYKDERDEKIKLPLYAKYELLKELGNQKGKEFFSQEKGIKKILDARNSSILAHGDIPIKEEKYKELLSLVLNFGKLQEKDLPIFPYLEI